eukprot:3254322-Amphidinium_carterae.1
MSVSPLLPSIIDVAWTTICNSRCSMYQFIENSSSTPVQELDKYHFDALRLAWSLGRLGLRRQFIVASTNNGSTFFEEPSLLADPELIEAMHVVAIKCKRYMKLRADLYNPHTQNNCLFMSAAYILRQHGIVMSQQEVRNRTAKLWLAGAECFGGRRRNLASLGCGQSPAATSTMPVGREHYTVVDERAIAYWYKTKASSDWRMLNDLSLFLRSNGIEVSPLATNATSSSCSTSFSRSSRDLRSSSCLPMCSTATLEMQLLAFQQFLAGGWLRRSSLCFSSLLLHYGGAGGKLRVSNVLRLDVPGRTQQFSGIQYQTAYCSAGQMHVGIGVAPPPLLLVIYLSGLDNTDAGLIISTI